VPLGVLTTASGVAVGIFAASDVATRFMGLAYRAGTFGAQPRLAFLVATLFAGSGLLLGLVAAGVLFGVWLHRAVSNLHRLGRVGMAYSPARSVASFYIPFVNLVRPYRVMKELWRATEPSAPADGGGWRVEMALTNQVDVWYGCWIGSVFASGISNTVEGASSGPNVLELAGPTMLTVGAIACIRMMRAIEARQESIAVRRSRARPPSG